jgi:hypothetical protein
MHATTLGWQAVADLKQAGYDLRRGGAEHATTSGVAGLLTHLSVCHSRIASPFETRGTAHTPLRARPNNKTRTCVHIHLQHSRMH